jgi:hypothetical protein
MKINKCLYVFQVGMVCVAKYEKDNQWYRAQVRSFTAHDVDVYFVDHGNSQTCPATSIMQAEAAFIAQIPSSVSTFILKPYYPLFLQQEGTRERVLFI